MPTWSNYRQTARSRGALAFELFVVESTLVKNPEEAQAVLPKHLEYQKQMESEGKLVLAGPLSDQSGEEMSGSGMIVYRAASMEEARDIALNDPMHKTKNKVIYPAPLAHQRRLDINDRKPGRTTGDIDLKNLRQTQHRN